MKRKILFAAAVCSSFSVFSQTEKTSSIEIIPQIKIDKEPKFFINLHTGYSVGLGSTFRFYPDDVSRITVMQDGNNAPSKTVEYSNPTKGLGDGFRFGVGGSYVINDFLNVNVDFDYFRSTIRKYRDSSIHQTNLPVTNNSADEYKYSERNTISYAATLLSFSPSITFKAIAKPKWFLYNKLGAVITFRPNSLQEDRTDRSMRMGWQGFYKDSSSTEIKKYEWGIRNPAYGFTGAFGGQLKLSKSIRLFAELQYSHIVFVIKKRTLTEYKVDDANLANTLSRSQKEIEFVRSFSSGATADPDKPSQTLIQRIPISYIGLQAGICIPIK
ncbi:MAG: hypothetical protein V4685_03705 [Bacteroidota bacterium]